MGNSGLRVTSRPNIWLRNEPISVAATGGATTLCSVCPDKAAERRRKKGIVLRFIVGPGEELTWTDAYRVSLPIHTGK